MCPTRSRCRPPWVYGKPHDAIQAMVVGQRDGMQVQPRCLDQQP